MFTDILKEESKRLQKYKTYGSQVRLGMVHPGAEFGELPSAGLGSEDPITVKDEIQRTNKEVKKENPWKSSPKSVRTLIR